MIKKFFDKLENIISIFASQTIKQLVLTKNSMIITEVNTSGEVLKKKFEIFSKLEKSSGANETLRFSKFFLAGDTLTITTMSSRVSVTDSVNVLVRLLSADSFTFFVETDVFASFFKNHTSEVTIVIYDNGDIVFKYDKGEFKTYWTDVKAYPSIFQVPEDGKVYVPSDKFIPSMKRAFMFMSNDEFRDILRNVLLDVKDGYVNIVTTDQMSMFVNSIFMGDTDQSFQSTISPEASRILYEYLGDGDKDEMVAISSDGTRLFLTFGDVIIQDVMSAGNFPNYRAVIDKSTETSIYSVNRKEWLDSLMSLYIAKSEEGIISVSIEDGRMVLVSRNLNYRKAIRENVDTQIIQGYPISFCFNHNLAVKAVKATSAPIIKLVYSEVTRAFLFKNPDDDKEVIFLIALQSEY